MILSSIAILCVLANADCEAARSIPDQDGLMMNDVDLKGADLDSGIRSELFIAGSAKKET